MIARGSIHLSLNPDTCGAGQGFNIADSSTPQNWESKWPQLCAYFSLKGTSPSGQQLPIRQFIAEHGERWKQLERTKGLRTGFAFRDDCDGRNVGGYTLSPFEFDRYLDLGKLRGTGFKEERSVMNSWGNTFDRMRAGKIIPWLGNDNIV